MDVNPVILHQALDKDFDYDREMPLTGDLPLAVARRLWLKKALTKKWAPTESKERKEKALSLFMSMNDRCATYCVPDGSEYVDDILETYRDMIHRICYTRDGLASRITWTDALQHAKFGKRAAAGTKAVPFFDKAFNSVVSTTSAGLYKHYRSHISDRWRDADNTRRRLYGLNVIKGSTLSFARKSEDIDRTICSEASLNMFYQLGAGMIIRDMLLQHYGINLSHQQFINRKMAKAGSLDGKTATIDLKSASDTIATKFVKWSFPTYTFNVLDSLRSKNTSVRDVRTGDTEVIELQMFSSMGNGFTFPLQTLIFATLVSATYHHMGIKLQNGENFGVNGDDIVCDVKAYHILCKVLARAGFIVNEAKSFAIGCFRESCGGDYFNGHDIRGVYLRNLSNEPHIYSAFNRLCRWSVRNNVSIPNLLRLVKGLAVLRPIPFDEGDSCGHKIPASCLTNRVRVGGCIRYTAVYARPITRRHFSRAISDTFPDAVIIAAMGGYLASDELVYPIDENDQIAGALKVVRKSTSSWDWIPHAGCKIRDFEELFEFDLVSL